MATEKESENYFRRSDRLYSIIPNTSIKNISKLVEKKSELIQLCQKQLALQQQKGKVITWRSFSYFFHHHAHVILLCVAKCILLQDGNSVVELYHEDKFKLPAWTHIYDEHSYKLQEYKVFIYPTFFFLLVTNKVFCPLCRTIYWSFMLKIIPILI